MSEKNYQSVSNYSYSGRRNGTPKPVQNGNDFDFAARNNNSQPQNDFNNNQPSQNNFNTNPYNNNGQPSQNNFNTNPYNDYSQPQGNFNTNPYNSYSQPPQSNFNTNPYNSYSQPQQNTMPTYQGYDSPNSWAGGAVEVPIDRSAENNGMIILWLFGIPFVLGMVFAAIWKIFNVAGIVVFLMGLFFVLSMFGLLGGIVVSILMEDARKRKVCTVAVTGQLAGYDSKRRSYHRKNHGRVSYTVYAPKYKIFINNRYEIRTLDRYTQNQNFQPQMYLLANPDGYEIIQGGNGGQQNR